MQVSVILDTPPSMLNTAAIVRVCNSLVRNSSNTWNIFANTLNHIAWLWMNMEQSYKIDASIEDYHLYLDIACSFSLLPALLYSRAMNVKPALATR